MKKFNRILIFIFAVNLFSACSVTNKINSSVYTTRQQPINREALPYNPMIADLKVDADKKISGTAIRQVDFATDAEVDNTKQLALYNAMANSGADVVIDPIFKVNISNNEGKDRKITIQADVNGYFAKYTSIHKADTTELKSLKLYRKAQGFQYVADREVTPAATTTNTVVKKSKKKGKIIGWTIGTLLITMGLGLGLGLGMRPSYY